MSDRQQQVAGYYDLGTIMLATAAASGLPFETVWRATTPVRRRRSRVALEWRYAAIKIATEHGYAAFRIGRIIGCEHTTIMYSLARWSARMGAGDPAMMKADSAVRAELASGRWAKAPGVIQRFRRELPVDEMIARQRSKAIKQALQEAMEREEKRGRLYADVKKLRSIGWSVKGIARRLEADPMVVAEIVEAKGERDWWWIVDGGMCPHDEREVAA